jgi:hypothetical protein
VIHFDELSIISNLFQAREMDELEIGMKLILNYNIRPDVARDYYEFVLGQYVPIMQQMGLEMREAWHTAYGDYPNRQIGFVTRDRDTMTAVIHGDDWESLNDQLLEYVDEFSYKVVPFKPTFQF